MDLKRIREWIPVDAVLFAIAGVFGVIETARNPNYWTGLLSLALIIACVRMVQLAHESETA